MVVYGRYVGWSVAEPHQVYKVRYGVVENGVSYRQKSIIAGKEIGGLFHQSVALPYKTDNNKGELAYPIVFYPIAVVV